MSQFIRSETEHPLLTKLTAAYFGVVKEEKFLSDAIRQRNQSRSELVQEPDRNAGKAEHDKFKDRQEIYRTAVLAERCAANILHRELNQLEPAIKAVAAKLTDNRDTNEIWSSGSPRDLEKNPLKGYAIEVAQCNVAVAIALYQQALATLLKVRVVDLGDKYGNAMGDCWVAMNFLFSLPGLWWRAEDYPETLQGFELFAHIAAKIAVERHGPFTLPVDRWSPQVVARIVHEFAGIGWNVTQTSSGDDCTPVLAFAERKQVCDMPAGREKDRRSK
jgi:hypothetical protein